jgi:MFS family permease
MVKGIIHRFLLRRHFWRYASFSEVAELYASRSMRLFALRMTMTFTSIYLLQEGYELLFICVFWAGFYGLKALFAWPAARLVAHFGPKHMTLYSNLLAAVSMMILPMIGGEDGLQFLVIWAIMQGASGTLYIISYNVDFSKVKSIEHAGKELAYMNIIEKLSNSAAPVVGGLLATLINPEIVMYVSAVVFVVAAMPLFRTGEPVRLQQKLAVRGFPWRTTWRSIVANGAIGIDIFISANAWTFFLAIVVFAGSGAAIYAQVGAATSVTIWAALASSYVFGKIIDKRRGKSLLRFGVLLNSLVHIFRVFIVTPVGVVMANLLHEIASAGYNMAFTRGLYDTADITGRRIVYLCFAEIASCVGAMASSLLIALLLLEFNEKLSLQLFFAAAGVLTLYIMAPRFALYKK